MLHIIKQGCDAQFASLPWVSAWGQGAWAEQWEQVPQAKHNQPSWNNSGWIVEFLTVLREEATQLRAKGFISKTALHGSGSLSTQKPFIATAPLMNLGFPPGFGWASFFVCFFLKARKTFACLFCVVWRDFCQSDKNCAYFLGFCDF